MSKKQVVIPPPELVFTEVNSGFCNMNVSYTCDTVKGLHIVYCLSLFMVVFDKQKIGKFKYLNQAKRFCNGRFA